MKRSHTWMLLAANGLVLCVLSFLQMGHAAPPAATQPFANSVEQRQEMLSELKDINAQLKDLNAYLRSGNLKVMIVLPDKNSDKNDDK